MFFELCHDQKDLLKHLVEKVEFHLHKTYKVPIQFVEKFPFSLTRNAWGNFKIKMFIHWKKWLDSPVKKIKHILIFDEEGSRNDITIEFHANKFLNIEGGHFLKKYRTLALN